MKTTRTKKRVATAAALALLAGVVTAGATATAEETAVGRPTLQRDTDAIRDTGVTGVLSRTTTERGRSYVAASGVADLQTGRPVSPRGYFRIGSTNKTLVATVLLQLAGERRISLADTVEEWLPGVVTGNGNDGSAITVRQLLRHTSGISDDGYPSMDDAEQYLKHRYDVRAPEETVASAMRHAPESAPGEEWHYSNTGYVVLGMIIERVTGNPWHEEVASRILEPLHMRHTSWPGNSPSLPRPHARGYTRFAPGEEFVNTTKLVDADASGGYLSTTADLDRFVRALFDGTLLTETELAMMRRTVPVSEQYQQLWPGARYGLGIISRPVSCGTAWFPSGDQLGFSTRTGVLADGSRSAVVSISTHSRDTWDDVRTREGAVTRLIDRALCG